MLKSENNTGIYFYSNKIIHLTVKQESEWSSVSSILFSLISVNMPAYTKFEKMKMRFNVEYLANTLMLRDKVLFHSWLMIKFLLIGDYTECSTFW